MTYFSLKSTVLEWQCNYQGKWNDILTNNYKGKFPHKPLTFFLPFFPTPLQL